MTANGLMRCFPFCLCALAAYGIQCAEQERIEITLPHAGDVFGEGGDWDKQYAREALQIFNDLKPDPEWVAKLQALPDNTWMHVKAAGDQQVEGGRSEVPMHYIPNVHALVLCCGCTSPGYSSDTWLYHTGANRWVQMWPNYIKGAAGPKLNRGPAPRDRPFTRCSLGLGWDSDRKILVLRGGANGNDNTTWGWNPVTNEWKAEAAPKQAPDRRGDNCVGFAPGFGTVEIIPSKDGAQTWVYRPGAQKWEKLATKGSPQGGRNSKLVWAAKQNLLIYWANENHQLWAFDPAALAWSDLTPAEGEKPQGFYRQGMAYDSANDVIFMFGTKPENNPNPGGPWIYDFATKSWKDMKTPKGPSPTSQGLPLCYDSEYNVVFMRGGWFYRYKQAKAKTE